MWGDKETTLNSVLFKGSKMCLKFPSGISCSLAIGTHMVGITLVPLQQVQADSNVILAGPEWSGLADAWRQHGRAVLNAYSAGIMLSVIVSWLCVSVCVAVLITAISRAPE